MGRYHSFHGLTKTPAYRSWDSMKTRCLNPKCSKFAYYGGRGIRVCERWLNFANFLADMGERPEGKTSLDRIDPNGNYEPGNCKWATSAEQGEHRRNNIMVEAFGETKTLWRWGDDPRCAASRATLIRRIQRGWTGEAALLTPAKTRSRTGRAVA